MPKEFLATETGPAAPPWYERVWADSLRSGSQDAMPETPEAFLERVSQGSRYAFQPIVDIHTGACWGYEALLRGSDALGFSAIADVFEKAWQLGCLHRLDVALRAKAFAGFARIDRLPEAKLFFNLEPRTLASPDYQPKRTSGLLEVYGIPPEALCLELTERHAATDSQSARVIDLYRRRRYKLALDDFGTGFSGLKLLYDRQPDFIKIDRYFISDIGRDNKRKLFVSSIVNLAHVLGISVIAEGVETEAEFLACKRIGCDLMQGWFVGRAVEDFTDLRSRYEVVVETNRRDRRAEKSDKDIVAEQIQSIPPLRVDEPLAAVFDAFRSNKDQSFFPVVDRHGQPLGIVRESDLKSLAYSPFGYDLASNRGLKRSLQDFVVKCPVADAKAEAEQILEIFALGENPEGIIIVEGFSYVGFLSAASLLRVVNAKNLAQARDQNPLSKLPGNGSINDYVAAALEARDAYRALVYFDFNSFKPFNDHYGFRQGDRAILLFADLMRKKLRPLADFIGHVGGDDFFAGFRDQDFPVVREAVRDLLATFGKDVESFYDPEALAAGGIVAKDREGVLRTFAFLSCSAAVIEVREGPLMASADDLIALFAQLKKEAKASPCGLAAAAAV
ncbi:MAG: GGDEF domain-containing protein [Magnetospirillum sp. WYHS-4]